MSKKKNKFKKNKVKISPKFQPTVKSTGTLAEDPKQEETSSLQYENVESKPLSIATDEYKEADREYAYVRRDISKILIVLFSLVIIAIGIYFSDAHFHFLAILGNWIYKIAHFSS